MVEGDEHGCGPPGEHGPSGPPSERGTEGGRATGSRAAGACAARTAGAGCILTGRGARGGTWCLGESGASVAARGCAVEGVPAGSKQGDGAKGTDTGLVKSSRKSKAARVGGEESSEKGKEDSSKITWREMMIRFV